MTKRRQILVIGNNESGCTPELEKLAYDVGTEIAKSDSVLITGGLGGVMRAACHGAHDAGGLTVGIIPQDNPSYANEFCDIVIPSGLGLSRDFLNALSADGVIIVGGGSGTLS
ncbi:MAG: TIGR00725 family protein, partial [Nitrososphaerota archaeon]|nr:TIGR00725 family protein [Nitrososphaerota archaeon]